MWIFGYLRAHFAGNDLTLSNQKKSILRKSTLISPETLWAHIERPSINKPENFHLKEPAYCAKGRKHKINN